MASSGINQYSTTPITDFYLEVAQLPDGRSIDPKNLSYYVVTPRQQHRPDKLSYDLYGSSRYWWLIQLLNRDQLKDSIRDLKTGMLLIVIQPEAINSVIGA
jgi:hypothetical protein